MSGAWILVLILVPVSIALGWLIGELLVGAFIRSNVGEKFKQRYGKGVQ